MRMSDFVTEFKSLRRPREGRLLFGVCRAIADRFGTDVLAIRIGVVLAAAVIDYVPLAYIVGVLFVPSVVKARGGERSFRQRGRLRQLLLFALLAGVADLVIDDSLPSSRTFALLLLLLGLAMMNIRSRSLRSSGVSGSPDATVSVGGWTSQPDDLPPRWGLAGDSTNPHLWTAGDRGPVSAADSALKRQSQFGNLAIVALVSVLAIGLWSNTSDRSPLRRAALLERVTAGPVKITNTADLEELDSAELGDGSFTIDLTEFDDPDTGAVVALDIEMGSGRLDIVVPEGTQLTGSVTAVGRRGTVVVRAPGSSTGPGPLAVTIADASGPSGSRTPASGSLRKGETGKLRKVSVSVGIANGLVCFRDPAGSDQCK